MKVFSEQRLALMALLVVLAVNAYALSAELSIGGVTGSDNISHWSLIQGMARAAETGGNPLDFWSPEESYGAATMRTYQPLAHALVVLLYFALGKTLPLITVFLWVRYLAIVLLPAGFFVAARLMELPPRTAAVAAALAPLISTNALYGLDYSSYVATGRGLFPQSVAAILLLLAIGYGFRAIYSGSALVLAGLFTGLTAVCHFIYGWIAAVTILFMALLPDERIHRVTRVRRTIALGCVALLVAAFQLLPVIIDRPFLNHSRWEGQWKFDSFGAAAVLKMLLTGELLDHDRPPVLTLLAVVGSLSIAWAFWRLRKLMRMERFLLGGTVLWLLLFFGRATWGPLLWILGAVPDLHLHRTIGALQLFLVLLAAHGLTALWNALSRRVHVGAALAVAILAAAIMCRERARYLAQNEEGGNRIQSAYAAEQPAMDAVIANLRQAGGRTYAGLGTTWGPQFSVAGIPFFAFLNMSLVPQTSVTYNLLPLTADLITSFDQSRPAEYRLLGIRNVVAPADLAGNLPEFLKLRGMAGRYRIFDAPPAGYFDVVEVNAWTTASKSTFYDLNQRWLHSNWPEQRTHWVLDFRGNPPRGLPRLPAGGQLPPAPAPNSGAGWVRNERQNGEIYDASLEISRASFALFKMTWHPNWVAYVDGRPQRTVMLTPGFIGVAVDPGPHQIRLRYEPGTWKLWLAIFGLLASAALAFAERSKGA